MNSRLLKLMIWLLTVMIGSVLLIGGCGDLGMLVERIALSEDDIADYTIHDVELVGPSGPGRRSDVAGEYTVRWRFVYRSGPAQPGEHALGVRPMVALLDYDDLFRNGDDLIAGKQHVPVNDLVNSPFPSSNFDEERFTLICFDGDVTGDLESTEEGTAEIYARVERANGGGRVETAKIDVECP